MRAILNWGIVAMLGMFVCVAPMVVAGAFAYRPSERLLALMRPLTLAAVFTALSNTTLGVVNSLVWLSRQTEPAPSNVVAAQMAEALAIPFVSFGCLSVAWILIAIGTRRQSAAV